MTANIGGRNVLVGIISFGDNKCLSGNEHPDIYTRVSSYVDWINDVIKSN